jgi:hypothetical protein
MRLIKVNCLTRGVFLSLSYSEVFWTENMITLRWICSSIIFYSLKTPCYPKMSQIKSTATVESFGRCKTPDTKWISHRVIYHTRDFRAFSIFFLQFPRILQSYCLSTLFMFSLNIHIPTYMDPYNRNFIWT